MSPGGLGPYTGSSEPLLEHLDELGGHLLFRIHDHHKVGGDDGLDVFQVDDDGFVTTEDARGVGGSEVRVEEPQVSRLDTQLGCQLVFVLW